MDRRAFLRTFLPTISSFWLGPCYADRISDPAKCLCGPRFDGAVGYWLGGKRIAFNPNLDLLAVAFLEERPPTAQFVPKLEDLGLQVTAVLTDGAVYIFRLRTVAHRRIQLFAGDSGQKLKRDLVNEVQSLISIPGTRVGSPLDATEGRIQIIDRQYVVQFKAEDLGNGIFRITPATALTKGEYGFYLVNSGNSNASAAIGAKFFDFGVNPVP